MPCTPQRPQLGTVSFDVRREDAGRGAGGAPAGPASNEHLDSRAPPGAFEGHGTADDAGPDHDDAHEMIFSWSSKSLSELDPVRPNVTDTAIWTSTGAPFRRVGVNSHCLTAVMADAANSGATWALNTAHRAPRMAARR